MGSKSVGKVSGTKSYTIVAKKIAVSGTNYDVEISGTGTNTKIPNKITEVYYKSSSGTFIKIDNFRDLSDDSITKIRVSVNTPTGTYTFRLVDELNNCYDANVTL